MSAAQMPERFIEPAKKKTVSEMKAGEVGWVVFADIYVDEKTKETFVDANAILTGPNFLFHIRLAREQNGFGMEFFDSPETNMTNRFKFRPLSDLARDGGVLPITSIKTTSDHSR